MPTIRYQKVIIETERYRFTGKVALPVVGRVRLSDYVNDPEHNFFSVTAATKAPRGEPDHVEEHDFILIARDHVLLLTPDPAAPEIVETADRF